MHYETVDRMIKWLENNMTEEPGLLDLSAEIGYSPYYCSSLFHKVTGTTIKSYKAARRLSLAAVAVRDTNKRLLDISIEYGFSSQQSFTRAFVHRYGCTPAVYRKNPVPIKLYAKKEVLFPEYYKQKGADEMSENKKPIVKIEYIPEHKYMCIKDIKAQDYWSFWESHNCDEVCGIIDSLSNKAHPILSVHTAGWFFEGEKRGYTYGMGLFPEYSGIIPAGFEVLIIPGGYYISFYYPPFDYLTECSEAVNSTDSLAFSFDPEELGFQWNKEHNQCYQKMMPETYGYEVLRPVTKL